MRVDIYQRNESDGKTCYLVVPEGRVIPNEATSTEWQTSVNGMDIDEHDHALAMLAIHAPMTQIGQKGYAITSLR